MGAVGPGTIGPMADVTPEAGGSSRELTPEQLAADTADLRASLAALAGLVTGSQGLHELLERVATFAANAIPGADGAGVTLLKVEGAAHRVDGLAASHPFVTEIDEIQYVTVKEGPCITAVLEGRTVRAGSLAAERMWPRFGPRVGRLGVHSALSLPLAAVFLMTAALVPSQIKDLTCIRPELSTTSLLVESRVPSIILMIWT